VTVLLGPWSLAVSVTAFLLAGAVTVAGAIRMAALGDLLAQRTGWGQAIFGAVFFGATSSLSGIVVTAVAAASDEPALAYSNAVGGIAAQTLAIAVADSFYRRANLEHAAASLTNILFGCLLTVLLLLVVLAAYVPAGTVLGVAPVSVLMVGVYLGGLSLIRRNAKEPMWQAVHTRGTQTEDVDTADRDQRATPKVWLEFILVGAVVSSGGARSPSRPRGSPTPPG